MLCKYTKIFLLSDIEFLRLILPRLVLCCYITILWSESINRLYVLEHPLTLYPIKIVYGI